MKKINYLFRYLPKHVKPWAIDCLGTLNDLTKVNIYRIENYEYPFDTEGIGVSTFAMYSEYKLLGTCHSILFNSESASIYHDFTILNEGNNYLYFEETDSKKYRFSITHAYLNDGKKPYDKSFLLKCYNKVKEFKQIDNHNSFIEESKESYFFEED